MTRRHFLAWVGGVSGVAGAPRWLFSPTEAHAAGGSFEVTRSEAEWRKLLSPEQFHVLRQHGTERPWTSPLNKEYGRGTYVCAGCELRLFASDTKFDSGTGWPSFWAPIEGAIGTSVDTAFFMKRTEGHCRRCGGKALRVRNTARPYTGDTTCTSASLIFNCIAKGAVDDTKPEPRKQ